MSEAQVALDKAFALIKDTQTIIIEASIQADALLEIEEIRELWQDTRSKYQNAHRSVKEIHSYLKDAVAAIKAGSNTLDTSSETLE